MVETVPTHRPLTPARRRWLRFKRSRRGYYSLIIFSVLFVVSLGAELISNDKPLLVRYQGAWHLPLLFEYPETTFGGFFETETAYRDPFFLAQMEQPGNRAIFPLNRHDFDSINFQIDGPVPSPPTGDNLLGTDDRGRDVLARLLYGFRLSVLFGLALTVLGTAVGILVGAIQGYLGGRIDLFGQRFIEIWGAMPELYLLIIFASIFEPSALLLLILLSLFSWMGLSDYVRAEFLKGRNLDYVRSAQALGVSGPVIMFRHLLPNGMTPVITFLPFRMSASILALTSLDFLGLGVPPSTPSLGELLAQGKANIDAWWLSLSTFLVLVGMLVLLIFIGEALREAFDPRKP
ncbi:ABC transporter permease [Desulfofustis limnaeus]|jgi:microcin C transport system permease protein|uniref:ABC transporter permease n=1 Tax=Desulfofustis limnaeus TaxID=2740163 RepID=A0ABM7W738_9BACT|nr:ABC transporter permease [Desulfofustis limnaeus]MDX9897070.1 ABC transporter permease [Desulfofustis sp.]BDD86709.1 ABC transporter permease [Desulfofustis limnaeus]